MKTKKVFLWSAGLSVAALIIVLILLNTLPPVLTNSEGISLYATLVSIVVGFFTVWGLYWAASEFSEAQIKPDLELIIGASHSNGVVPLLTDTGKLWGQDNIHSGYAYPPVSKVVFGLLSVNWV